MTETPTSETASTPAATNSAGKVLEPSDYNQFLLRSLAEIRFVLRELIENVSQITIFFNEGKDLLLTTLAAIDDEGLIFDVGASSEMNRRAQEVNKLFCIATLNKVKVQFILKGLSRIEHEGRPAFRAAYPETLLRLQRREYYRLTMPVTRPLSCIIPLPNSSDESVAVNLVDISAGGLALVAPPPGIRFEPGDEFPGCRIELPDIGTIVATLKVRSLFELTLRSGNVLKRSGCEFIKLPGPMMTMIQRYIIKVERERKARESGLA